jgi:hypothetical protein
MWMFENVDHMEHINYVCYHLCQNKGGYAQFAIVLTSRITTHDNKLRSSCSPKKPPITYMNSICVQPLGVINCLTIMHLGYVR